jgi:hypothetical protein
MHRGSLEDHLGLYLLLAIYAGLYLFARWIFTLGRRSRRGSPNEEGNPPPSCPECHGASGSPGRRCPQCGRDPRLKTLYWNAFGAIGLLALLTLYLALKTYLLPLFGR